MAARKSIKSQNSEEDQKPVQRVSSIKENQSDRETFENIHKNESHKRFSQSPVTPTPIAQNVKDRMRKIIEKKNVSQAKIEENNYTLKNNQADYILVNGNHVYDDSNVDISVAPSETDKQMISSIRQIEILRCFAQYLLEKNYKDTYEKLVSESGVVLENHNVAKLRESVLSGNWDQADKQWKTKILHGVELLRERLTPMNLNRDRVHHLATCLMYKEISELHNMASWKGKGGGRREI